VVGNELIDGPAGTRLGLFDEALPAADVLPRALETAARLGAMPAAVYERSKGDLRDGALNAMRAAAAADPLLGGWR
jgi:hypothetical protein